MIILLSGYLFLFIFRPFEYYPILGGYHIEKIYAILLIAAALFSPKSRYKSHSINYAVFLFFSMMIVSAYFAYNTNAAIETVVKYFNLLIIYLVMVLVIEDAEDLKHFVMIYLAIMFVYMGKSAWEFFIHGRYEVRMGIKRMCGIDITYGDPNAFAASIAYTFPLMWGLLIEHNIKKINRLFLIAYALLGSLCIIYTGSRSGMLAVLLFLIFLIVKIKKKIIGVAVLIMSLFLIWNIIPQSYQIRFESIFVKGVAEEAGQSGADESAEGRLVGLKHGVKVFKEHPLAGIGPGNSIYSWDRGNQVHNLYGQLLAELGFIGTSTFLVLILTMCFSHYRNGDTCDLWISNLSVVAVNDNNKEKEIKNNLIFLKNISTASIQVTLLLLFNGNFGHNLYRYNWLWICAIAVCSKWSIDHMKYYVK